MNNNSTVDSDAESSLPEDSGDPQHFPPGALNANWFNLFNAISFQITLGSPMILYAKSIGASATTLGIIAALTPLLNIFQLPAAHFMAKIGYKRFVLMGWGTRSIFIFFISLIPLATFVDPTTRIVLVLTALFGFNLMRGISSGAWMPWITELIPEKIRGRFLSRDQIFTHLGSFVALIIAAICMSGATPSPWQFSIVFFISASGAWISLLFLRKIPDIDSHETMSRSGHRVPWGAIITYAPFARLLFFNLLFVLAIGGMGTFTVAYLKTMTPFTEGSILLLVSLNFIGALAGLPLTGRILDSTGSKPILFLSLGLFLVVIGGWFLLSSELLSHTIYLVALLNLLGGMASANFNLANVRIMMNTMPPMGRNHFFALFAVLTSLGLGAAPIIWGLFIDGIGNWTREGDWLNWNRYSLYFSTIFLLCLINALITSFLHEQKPKFAPDNLLVAKMRRFSRYWQR